MSETINAIMSFEIEDYTIHRITPETNEYYTFSVSKNHKFITYKHSGNVIREKVRIDSSNEWVSNFINDEKFRNRIINSK